MLSSDDLKKRSRGVGSSEIGMLIYVEDDEGVLRPLSPWGGRHKLWRRKTGKEEWVPPKSYMDRGTYLEPGVIEWYAHDADVEWAKPPTIRHPDYSYVVDSCDGLTFPKGTSKKEIRSGDVKALRCIEAKVLTGFKDDGFGEQGTDQIPYHYLVQAQWHIGAHKPAEMICDFPVDIDGGRRDYYIEYDEELYLALVSEAERFWMDYVEKDKEPPIDDPGDTAKWLSKHLKNRAGIGLLDANEEQAEMMLEYRDIQMAIEERKVTLEELKEKLMRAIDEHEGIIIPGTRQKILWKNSKERKTINWKGIAEQLAQTLFVKDMITKDRFLEMQNDYCKISAGNRPWTPTSLLKNGG